MAVFPLRLKTEQGQRRLNLLARLLGKGSFAMNEIDDPVDRKDIQWAWDKDLVTVVDTDPMRYEITAYGRGVITRGRELLDEERGKEAA